MAIIELIPNEKYKIDCWPDGRNGKRHREILYCTQADAEAHHKTVMRQHTSRRTVSANPRLVDVQPDFEKWLKANKADGYCKTWKYAFKRFMPHFGLFPVSRITKPMVNEYKDLKKGTPVALQQDLDYLRIYINWMVEEGYAAAPLPFTVEKVQYQKPLPRPTSVNEFDTFIKYLEGAAKQARLSEKELNLKKALFCLIYESTGMRSVEARHLLWEDVNLEDRWCYVRRTKTKVPRFAVLPASTVKLLAPYKQASGYVFLNPKTEKPYGSFKTLFKNFRKETGIYIKGPHAFRHAMGTDTINATGDVRTAQVILGHKTLKATQIYTTVGMERQKRVIEEVAKYRETQREIQRQKELSTEKGELSTGAVSTVDTKKRGNLRLIK